MNQFTQMPDIKSARSKYRLTDGGEYMHLPQVFSAYSPAYVITNEDIRWVSGFDNNNGARVLTVTGSGDQPMFYAMRGAKTVDTFDISYCARAIMDIKSAAIRKLSRPAYIKLLTDLHNAKSVSQVSKINTLINDLPHQSVYFIREMAAYPLFTNGLEPGYYPESIPTAQEYEQMRAKITEPFNFIWTDLETLHTKITGEYDTINLSNILDYAAPEKVHTVLTNLRPHISVGGKIIVQNGVFGIARNSHAYISACDKFKDWAKIYYRENKRSLGHSMVAICQRIK